MMTGEHANLVSRTIQDGGVLFNPIPSEMLRTVHTTPQVYVKINTIASTCLGDCGFHWSAASTPTVTDINPTQGEYNS